MSTWYYASAERQQLGPVSTDELKQYFHSEQISLETLVWRDGMLHWRPLHELAQQLGLLPALAASEVASALPTVGPPILPTTIIDPAPANEPEAEPELAAPATPAIEAAAPTTLAAVAGASAPSALNTALPAARAGSEGRAVFSLGTEPSPAPAPVYPRVSVDPGTVVAAGNPYAAGQSSLQDHVPLARANEFVVDAGFWKRVAASAIDSVILMVAGGICAEVLGALLSDLFSVGVVGELVATYFCALTLNVLYHAWFHSTLAYATPGKMVIGIKVLRSNGTPITFLRGVGRGFAAYLSSLLLCVGHLFAAFTARKQALHDLMCDTVVVDKWAYTDEPERQNTELGTATVVVLVLMALAVVLVFVAFMMIGLSGIMGRL